jgi:hypothetical protein
MVRGSAISAVILICVFYTPGSLADQPLPVVLRGSLSLSDLPQGVQKRISPQMTREQIANMLRQQPSVTLQGATLTLQPPADERSIALAFDRVVLQDGSKVVTNGVNLELVAAQLSSDEGEITAFSAESIVPNPAPQRQDGVAGLNAGTVVLDTTLGPNKLFVRLNGMPGQPGGPGAPGPTGAPGTRGGDAADHLLDCAHGGGDGGPGAKGGTGGSGGKGGPGGSGGKLILEGPVASQRLLIDFVARGGQGGAGGSGGDGGQGGPGGDGGSGSTYCRGGRAGPTGPLGDPGPLGGPGQPGHDGSITAQ